MQTCSKCGVSHSRNGRYCPTCHAAYQRDWRRARRELVLTPETIRAGEAELRRAAEIPTMSAAETACRVFAAMHGPRAKRRKVA